MPFRLRVLWFAVIACDYSTCVERRGFLFHSFVVKSRLRGATIVKLPKRVYIAPNVLMQVLNDEAVLLDLNGERYYGLNIVGTRVWQLLAENSDVDAALKQLLTEFRVDAETLRRDLATLFQDLVQAKLITVE